MFKMITDKSVLPSEFNLVRFDVTELVVNKSLQTSDEKDNDSVKKRVRLLDSGDDGIAIQTLNCEDVLNRILPPKEWIENKKHWRKKVSNIVAIELDVKRLVKNFDLYLEQFKAREVGLCPIKRELYAQCFNEIIRIVTMQCAERGNILIKIRDEIKMTFDAYEKLYTTTTAYGIRKALLKANKKSDVEKQVEKTKSEIEMLKAELAETISKTYRAERELVEERETIAIVREEELKILRKENKIIKNQLRTIFDVK